jgi:hypothetical protein
VDVLVHVRALVAPRALGITAFGGNKVHVSVFHPVVLIPIADRYMFGNPKRISLADMTSWFMCRRSKGTRGYKGTGFGPVTQFSRAQLRSALKLESDMVLNLALLPHACAVDIHSPHMDT